MPLEPFNHLLWLYGFYHNGKFLIKLNLACAANCRGKKTVEDNLLLCFVDCASSKLECVLLLLELIGTIVADFACIFQCIHLEHVLFVIVWFLLEIRFYPVSLSTTDKELHRMFARQLERVHTLKV